MKRLILFFLSTACCAVSFAQEYTSSSIFAHNDYVQPMPFYGAYALGTGYIEADIFLRQNSLLVAHTEAEIDKSKTLEELYMKPLVKQIERNKGYAYTDQQKRLTLMIDLKTEGVATLSKLVDDLKKYPAIISCKTLDVTVSGNVPGPKLWKDFPSFIHFDGRPEIAYTEDQLSRISLISTNFRDHSSWNGKDALSMADRSRIISLRDAVHAKGKKLRFWGAPDLPNVWLAFMHMQIDIIGSDNIADLFALIKSKSGSIYQNQEFHQSYRPTYQYQPGKKPKNVILLIGDGMGLAQLYSGYTANKGSLNIFQLKDIGFSVTTSTDSYITDSAAGATAFACGRKTNNRSIGVDSVGVTLSSITEKMKSRGFRTAIISSGDITDATPACFYAHQPDRNMSEEIASDFIKSNTDILIGGRPESFTKRKDGVDLFNVLRAKGYTVSSEISTLDTIRSKKFVVLDDAAVVSKIDGRGDFLSRSITKSLSVFSKEKEPFFMMAEGAQIDYGGHYNNVEYVIKEMLDFDKAIGEAMKFVDANEETLLIITADHETGGLTLTGGDISKGYTYGNFSTGGHTGIPVPVFAYGPGADLFRGVYQNTEINIKLTKVLNLDSK